VRRRTRQNAFRFTSRDRVGMNSITVLLKEQINIHIEWGCSFPRVEFRARC